MSAISDSSLLPLLLLFALGVRVLVALDRLGEALDPSQTRVPSGTHVGKLRDGAGELGLIDAELLLATGRGRAHQADAVEDDEVLRHRLTRHWQACAQSCRGPASFGQEQVEYTSADRVADS